MAVAACSWLLGGDTFLSSAAVSDESSYLSAAFPSRRGALAVSTLHGARGAVRFCLGFLSYRFTVEGISSFSTLVTCVSNEAVLGQLPFFFLMEVRHHK